MVRQPSDDERFKTRERLLNNKAELIVILDRVFAERDSLEWIQLLRNAGLIAEKLGHFRDVTKDPQAWANDFLVNKNFSNGRESVLPCPPLKSVSMGQSPNHRGPFAGEHTQEVLEELGYPPFEIDELKNKKSIGTR